MVIKTTSTYFYSFNQSFVDTVVIDVRLGKENTVQSSTTATGSELKPPDARTDFQTKLGGFFFLLWFSI
jgi:hypothetical protein